MLENLTSAAKLSNKEAHPDSHQLQKTYTDTQDNSLVKTVLLPRSSPLQNSALAHIDKMFSGNDLQQVAYCWQGKYI